MSRRLLSNHWELCSSPPGQISAADDPQLDTREWIAATVPSTAASALSAAGLWSLDGPARDFDKEDWWYRLRFSHTAPRSKAGAYLVFEGLATVADVWLNRQHVLASESMFLEHRVRVDDHLAADNELLIRFRALTPLLAAKRPRSRWRVPMIEQQQLRWHRTSLLGRTPGWSPPAAAVGPWRPIYLQEGSEPSIESAQLRAVARGDAWVVIAAINTQGITAAQATLIVQREQQEFRCRLSREPDGRYTGELSVASPDLWWPHTHGDPALYQAWLEVRDEDQADQRFSLGHIGFRTLALDRENGDFRLSVNGVPIFCRGGCWTPLDPVSLSAQPDHYAQALDQLHDAGMNMVRVGGTMVYEAPAFYEACDRLGILVWQDFMFANMDYPEGDADFMSLVARESEQVIGRLATHPCLALLCGNSEAEQQAAMWGAARDRWQSPLFHEFLPGKVTACCPEIPYWPSSAHGGAFPHEGSNGTTSYYGVGAYLRPLDDARRAEIRFASECLAFANVPEPTGLRAMPGGTSVRVHHPGWKARSPRDLGAGWDFDDVRDHYLRELFDIEPLSLRYSNHDRYLRLSRVVSGEVMAATFGEWRRKRSTCNGALIWFLRDLWAGAGWGVFDAAGRPKAPLYYLRRALRPIAISISDEGGNGLFLHVANDRPQALRAMLSLTLYRSGHIKVASVTTTIEVPGHDALQLPAAALFDGFVDLSYAYRFGPAPYDIAVATLQAPDLNPISEAFHYLTGYPTREDGPEPEINAVATPLGTDTFKLTLAARRFAYAVTVESDGYACEDQYFNLVPGSEKTLVLRANEGRAVTPPRGYVHALNTTASKAIEVRE